MSNFDPNKIRQDFPILSTKMNGRPLIYLDNAATTQKPLSVIKELERFYSESNANIHRGVYPLAEEATRQYENVRKQVAAFLNSKTTDNIIFTRNTTESINLVAHSWARKHLKSGDEILLTVMEHHGNFVPWYLLSKEKGVSIKLAPLKDNHTLDVEAFKKLLGPKVKLVCVTACSNVLGTLTPVKELIDLAHKNGSKILIDGAQSVPHIKTDLTAWPCDFFAFSGHKMLGPTGVGVLWISPDVIDSMDPFLGGGEMINSVSVENITWAEPPLKFEAGTNNFADVVAFGKAIEYLTKIGMDNVRQHEKELVRYALQELQKSPDIKIFGPKDPEKQSGAISFNHKVVHAHDVGTILGEEGVAIRVGHHCAQPLMKWIGIPATARASFYIYNTKEDVDAFIKALQKVDKVFGLSGAKQS